MPNFNINGSAREQLNRSSPAAADAKLGDVLTDLVKNFNALAAKLDADAGVTDTNYAATLAVKDIESR